MRTCGGCNVAGRMLFPVQRLNPYSRRYHFGLRCWSCIRRGR